MRTRQCVACGGPLPPGAHARRKYCADDCGHKRRPAPVVYRYTAPDGRNYVGSVVNGRYRHNGVCRTNARLTKAFAKHPPETWVYEVPQELPPGCSEQALRAAEQHHIERLGALTSKRGFNIEPAVRRDKPSLYVPNLKQYVDNKRTRKKHAEQPE
jgi:hypothetical protein